MFGILQQRSHYWSCSKFALWILFTFSGLEKPASETWEGWQTWRKDAKVKNRFVYWFTEEALDNVQSFLFLPYDILDNVRTYCVNRFVTKLHFLPTQLTPGTYYDLDHRLLYGIFEALVNFVEVEKSHMHLVFEDKDTWKKYNYPWWWRIRILRWVQPFRSAEAGLDHLKWEMTLNDECPGQAAAAKEQFELYDWWKNVRPNRCDLYKDNNLSYEEVWKKELEYDEEDETMLIRLIKIRKSLWT